MAAKTYLRCEGCGAEVTDDDVIKEGTYRGGHYVELSHDEAMERGYPFDPCGPVAVFIEGNLG